MKTLSETIKENMDHNQIISDIEQFIADCVAEYKDCYVGLSNNPPVRIHEAFINEGHTTDGRYVKGDPAIVRDAGTNEAAIAIEKHFHAKGARGGDGPGTGKKSSKYVYCIIDRLHASNAVK